jgi:hypothetical protein
MKSFVLHYEFMRGITSQNMLTVNNIFITRIKLLIKITVLEYVFPIYNNEISFFHSLFCCLASTLREAFHRQSFSLCAFSFPFVLVRGFHIPLIPDSDASL